MTQLINKNYKDLSSKEKYTLQNIIKKNRKGLSLSAEERDILNKFIVDYEKEEKRAKARWPLIIILLAMSLFAVLRRFL